MVALDATKADALVEDGDVIDAELEANKDPVDAHPVSPGQVDSRSSRTTAESAADAPPLVPPWASHRVHARTSRQADASPRTAVATPEPASSLRSSRTWLWSGLVGAILGGVLGLGLSLLVFLLLNGALDMGRTRAVTDLQAQLTGLSTELDAVRTDTSTLQGEVGEVRAETGVLQTSVSRLQEDVDGLVDLPPRVSQAETALAALGESVDELEAGLAAVEEANARTTSFFQGMQTLLSELFGDAP